MQIQSEYIYVILNDNFQMIIKNSVYDVIDVIIQKFPQEKNFIILLWKLIFLNKVLAF